MSAQIAEIAAEIDRLGLRPETCSAIFIGGSLSRGWGHARSDVDAYIVSTIPWSGPADGHNRVKLDPPVIPLRIFDVGGRRCEVRFWLDSQVDQLFAKLTWSEFERERRLADLSAFEAALLSRVKYAVPIDGEDWLVGRREQLAGSAYRSMVVAQLLDIVDGHVEDALGLLESGDHRAAAIAAQTALERVVEALLSSRGDMTSVAKWRVRRLEEANLEVLSADRYWEIATFRTYDPDKPQVWVESVLETCRQIILEVEG
ncbi:hypothetical protein [Catellatospora tritici]|uniref:hypothetical protein n=1 Tax=Catellatospora tritici TaxID=2851566 RepID=UPI001C2DADD7|nr:hypothetical protein [Catellatospora tritici]MBV1849565.1 hypothetical protein [Catellatospora tritici]